MKQLRFFVFLLWTGIIPLGASGSVEVIGSLKINAVGKPGNVITGEIKIQNSDNFEQGVKVYQTELLYNYQDYTIYAEDETHPRSNRSWIRFSPELVTLPANSTSFIQYEISIPPEADICGTFWSILMVEGVSADISAEAELSIKTVTRYAIQMITDIEDKGKGLLEFMKPTLITEGDKLFLAVDLVNTGDHYISPEISMELFNEAGESVAVIKANRKGLLPTTSARYRLDLAGLTGNQTYSCLIIADGKEEDVFGLEYTLYF